LAGFCSQKAETVVAPVFAWKQAAVGRFRIAPSVSAAASWASRVVVTEIRQSDFGDLIGLNSKGHETTKYTNYTKV
jgi:hypothetical protein